MNTGYDIYVSYAIEDIEFAEFFVKSITEYISNLTGLNLRIFSIYKDAQPETDWQENIVQAVVKSAVYLAICSGEYFETKECVFEWKNFINRDADADDKILFAVSYKSFRKNYLINNVEIVDMSYADNKTTFMDESITDLTREIVPRIIDFRINEPKLPAKSAIKTEGLKGVTKIYSKRLLSAIETGDLGASIQAYKDFSDFIADKKNDELRSKRASVKKIVYEFLDKSFELQKWEELEKTAKSALQIFPDDEVISDYLVGSYKERKRSVLSQFREISDDLLSLKNAKYHDGLEKLTKIRTMINNLRSFLGYKDADLEKLVARYEKEVEINAHKKVKSEERTKIQHYKEIKEEEDTFERAKIGSSWDCEVYLQTFPGGKYAGKVLNLRQIKTANELICREIKRKHFDRMKELTELTFENAQLIMKYVEPDSPLNFAGVTSITRDVCLILSKHTGDLILDNITELNEETAQCLSKYKGWLFLNGLKSLDPKIAKILAKHVNFLSLNGLTALRVPETQELVNHKGDISLNGLLTLSNEVAELLIQVQGDITLLGLNQLHEDTAKILSKHKYELYTTENFKQIIDMNKA